MPAMRGMESGDTWLPTGTAEKALSVCLFVCPSVPACLPVCLPVYLGQGKAASARAMQPLNVFMMV